MKINYAFHEKLLLAFSIACIVVVLLMVIALQLTRNAALAMEWVQHTYEVLNHVVQARSYTFQIELNTQSYRITGDEKRIADRDKLIYAREQSLNLIKESTRDNPRQQLQWSKLRKIIDERLAISRRMTFLMRTQGPEAANAYIATTRLQETRDEMHQVFIDMEKKERQLLSQRLTELKSARELMVWIGIIVGTFLIAVLIFTFLLIRRQMQDIEASRKALAESENKLSITLHSIGDGVVATDTDGCITRMNSVAEKLTGWKLSEAIGHPIEEVFHIINESTGKLALIPIRKAIQTREIQNLENHTVLIARNGDEHPIADSAAPIIDSNGNLSGVVLVFRDVSLEREAELLILEQNNLLEKKVQERTFELNVSEKNLRNVTDNVPALIAYVNTDERYVYTNQQYIDRFSPGSETINGLSVREVLGNDRYAIAQPRIAQALRGESCSYDWQPFPNVWHMVNYVPTADADGSITGYYVMISDITERKLSELELYKITHYDDLTGLPNENLFTDLLTEAIEAGQHLNQSFPLVQVNIEKLSEINDALGFSGGDQVLREFAERLKLAAPAPCKIARLRGDEFAILLDHGLVAEALAIVAHLEGLLTEPIVISNIPLDISAKIGIAIFPQDGTTPHDLYRHIDFAVRQAQKKGSRFEIFDHTQYSDKPYRLALAAELRRAIDQNDLTLYLQPQVEFSTGKICSVEALIRWNHPERGLVFPNEFIPLAEQIGLIKPLTQWVMNAAMQLIHDWQSSGFVMPIGINLSARNLFEDDLVERIHHMIAKWEVSTGLFALEITESSIMDDAEHALGILQQMRKLGIPLSIDDFGTGYSSLSYLQRLPMQFIKIDQSFVREMLLSKESLMIVRSTIDLAHDLGKAVVAEGVETREHWEQLAELGCDIAQGYFIAKPMPVATFMNWIQDFQPPVTASKN